MWQHQLLNTWIYFFFFWVFVWYMLPTCSVCVYVCLCEQGGKVFVHDSYDAWLAAIYFIVVDIFYAIFFLFHSHVVYVRVSVHRCSTHAEEISMTSITVISSTKSNSI